MYGMDDTTDAMGDRISGRFRWLGLYSSVLVEEPKHVEHGPEPEPEPEPKPVE